MRVRFFIYGGLICLAQGVVGQNPVIPANSLVVIDLPDHSRMANVKDTNYTRVLDGLYIEKNYPVNEPFKEVAYVGNMEDVKLLGVKSKKPLMLINTKAFPIEAIIDTMLVRQNKFPDFPSYVKLPLLVNGKFITYAERLSLLSSMKQEAIKSVKYLNPDEAQKLNKETPFGFIEVSLK